MSRSAETIQGKVQKHRHRRNVTTCGSQSITRLNHKASQDYHKKTSKKLRESYLVIKLSSSTLQILFGFYMLHKFTFLPVKIYHFN